MTCNSQRGQGFDGMCLECGNPIAASGCDGGSWVHVSTAPDRVISTTWYHGYMVRQRLANGVVIRYKHGGIPMNDVLRARGVPAVQS